MTKWTLLYPKHDTSQWGRVFLSTFYCGSRVLVSGRIAQTGPEFRGYLEIKLIPRHPGVGFSTFPCGLPPSDPLSSLAAAKRKVNNAYRSLFPGVSPVSAGAAVSSLVEVCLELTPSEWGAIITAYRTVSDIRGPVASNKCSRVIPILRRLSRKAEECRSARR